MKRAYVTLVEGDRIESVRGIGTWPFASASRQARDVGSRRSRTSRTSPRRSPSVRCSRPSRGTGGRNNLGRKTARHKGGGHKQRYRIVDFRRVKDGVPAKRRGDRVRPEPQQPHRAAALPRRREGLHPRPQHACRSATCSRAGRAPRSARATRCRCATSRSVRRFTTSSSSQAAAARWPAAPARACSWSPRKATSPPCACRAPRCAGCRSTAGPRSARSATPRPSSIKIGKAGRNRWKGVRPQTRGVAMNPVDHPHGGGEGKTSGGRHPVSPWGKPEGRTRNKKKPSQKLIIRRRRTRGSRR